MRQLLSTNPDSAPRGASELVRADAFGTRPSHVAALSVLNQLLWSAALCSTQRELAELTVQTSRAVFCSAATALVLLDGNDRVVRQSFSGIAGSDSRCADANGRLIDPILSAVVERQVTLHSGHISIRDAATSTPVSGGFSPVPGAFHSLAAPLYGGRGKVVAAFGVCRRPTAAPFDGEDIHRATALTGHLSVAFARLPSLGHVPNVAHRLTPRERQVASFVMQGANNLGIASSLQISRETVKKALQRIYEKLNVHGRAEMVARLLATHGPASFGQAPDQAPSILITSSSARQ